ncbi:hypothetical protein VF06_37470 [Nostoc linckia z4]|uniref:Uncharacterized protein n=1 Tax=Nostoc linckia z8 TaxID=1628746 RepID=A0A9Q5ZAY2_NOSLI|nr:hypothetical protein [Nostoc linckia]PHJ54509.1 hypothetical protein VF02_36630 [Nostoc linckia z1]PHJ69413.1 hypothetical protein VF03_24045 [Nostoc linckia z2]PHJ70862.1 hypothetical protein VF06_37470 [Nostoc linckia z4]PHJ79669.1 hypothetical protein VF07_33330 [Nostoc linckia z6]PHK02494.1 hypothetical protein VF08_18330 [Nostoc linckia z8]
MLADKPKINLDKKPKFDLEKTPDSNFPIKRKQKQDIKKKSLFFPDIEEPQESLEKFVGDFYTTPFTPADPTDCDRYPDSPWCGENPIDLTSPVGIELSIVLDGCNFGVQFSGTLGFIKVPPFQIVYRNPDCKPLEPPRPPDPVVDDSSKMPANCPYGLQSYIVPKKFSHEYGLLQDGTPYFVQETYTQEIKKIRFPSDVRYLMHGTGILEGYYADFYIDIFVTERVTLNSGDAKRRGFLNNSNIQYWLSRGGTFSGNPYDLSTVWEYYNEGTIRQYENTFTRQNSERVSLSQLLPTYLPGGIQSPRYMSKKDYEALPNPVTLNQHIVFPEGGTDIEIEVYKLLYICGNYDPPPPTDPPPPPRPKKCKCMCCDDNNNENLLKLILRRIGSLPASVPDNFTKQNPSMISIESLAELMLWQMQQLDALMGAYPIEIEIEDSDLVKEGNQKQKIKVPNQAEAIAELLGMILTIKRDTHATLITAIKAMGEAGMTKQLATKTLDVSLANAEFLGYKLEQKKKQIPSLFTPGGKDISETLKEKNVEIVSYENTDKKDLQDDLKTLLTMAARWNAQNWRKIDANNPKESLKNLLINNVQAVSDAGKEDSQDDFDNFTEQCERGFIDVSGISDTANPWGRQYKERPKIREIGTDKNAGNNDNEAEGGE